MIRHLRPVFHSLLKAGRSRIISRLAHWFPTRHTRLEARPLVTRPKHPQPATASIGTLVPRPLAHSELSRAGDRIEVLCSRYNNRFVRRLLEPGLSPSRRWKRFPLDFRGSRIWCLLDGRRTVEEVIETYEYRYPGDACQVSQRVWSYLQTLQRHGFIEVVPSD